MGELGNGEVEGARREERVTSSQMAGGGGAAAAASGGGGEDAECVRMSGMTSLTKEAGVWFGRKLGLTTCSGGARRLRGGSADELDLLRQRGDVDKGAWAVTVAFARFGLGVAARSRFLLRMARKHGTTMGRRCERSAMGLASCVSRRARCSRAAR